MAKREIEGDWVMGWPDRKRAELNAGKDAEGRVISGRTPILDQEGLITPTNNYYIVVKQAARPDGRFEYCGAYYTLEQLQAYAARTGREVQLLAPPVDPLSMIAKVH